MINAPKKSLPGPLFDIPLNTFTKKYLVSTTLCLLIFFALLVPCLFTSPAVALELPYPDPLSPKDGNTITTVTSVVFSWKPFYIGTNTYSFELSKSAEMLNPIIMSTITNGLTTYTYTGTLEYNTTYYWRVMSQDPRGDWSPVTPFKTPAPATTNNTTGAKPPQDSSKSALSSITDYIEKNIGWPLFGGIIVVLIIVVIVLIKISKPKSPPGGQRQGQGEPPRPPYMQQPPSVCSVCGFPNTPDRKFCNSCGTSLFRGPPPPPPPPPPPQPQPPPMGAFPQIITCPVCRTANPPTQQFCMRCGTSLMSSGPQQSWTPPQQSTNCPACGAPIAPGKQFCGNCGTNMGGGPQQQNYQVFQSYSCPVCGAQINKGFNPCPSCGSWLDWQALGR